MIAGPNVAVTEALLETAVPVLWSWTLQPKMVAHVAVVDIDVVVVPRDTTDTREVVVEQIDALLVSQGLSGSDE